jgi:hypothetical protein
MELFESAFLKYAVILKVEYYNKNNFKAYIDCAQF